MIQTNDPTMVIAILGLALGLVFVVFVVAFVRQLTSSSRGSKKSEALFRSMFPDLQPHFHPRRLLEFVRARRAARPPQSGKAWKNPPGFDADRAEIRFDNGVERVQVLDAAGALLAQFVFEEHPEGGVLRVDKGKFTVNPAKAAVRYWHPEREFKWKNGVWTFQTRVSDRSIDSSDTGTSYSSGSSSSSSPSSTATAAAAGAGIAAAGGTFDGGGASAGWDRDTSRTSY